MRRPPERPEKSRSPGTSRSGRWAPRARSSTCSPRTSWRRTPTSRSTSRRSPGTSRTTSSSRSVAGSKTPDVSQMGTTWMGEFAKTGALEEVPDSIDQDSFFEGARDTAIVDGTAYGVPWYVETRAPLLPQGHRREGRDHRAAQDLGRAQGDGEGAEGEGRREVRHLARAEQLAGVPAVRLADRRRGRRRTTSFTFDSPEAVEALEYYKSFFDEGLTRGRRPAGLRRDAGLRRRDASDVLQRPVAHGPDRGAGRRGASTASGRSRRCRRRRPATSFVGGSDLVVFKDSDNKDAAWKFVEYLSQPDVQQKWYDDGQRPAVGPVRLGERHARDRRQPRRSSASSSRTRSRRPSLPKWEQVAADAVNTELEKATHRRLLGRAGRQGDAAEGRVDRDRVSARHPRRRRRCLGARLAARLRPHLTGWLFALPFVAHLPRLPRRPDPRVVRPLLHGLRDREPAGLVQRRVRRPRQLHEALRRRALPEGGAQHRRLRASSACRSRSRRGLLAAVGLNQAIGRMVSVLPRRLLPARS